MRASNNQALLALLASIASRAVAENPILPQWRPSLPTQGLDPYDRVNLQISPRPTKSPQFNPKDLRRRADDTSIGSNTCGFLTGDHSAFPCDEGYTCTNIGDYRGCCRGTDCTTSSFSSVCLDATEEACSSYTPGTMCCTAESIHSKCVTYLWATTATPNAVFSLYVCDTDSWAGKQILDAEPGEATTTSDEQSSTSKGDSSSSTGGPVPTAPNTGGDGSDDNNDDGGSKSNVGPIVGGVVGGVAVVAGLVMLGVWLMMRSRKKERAALANANANNNNAYMGGGDDSIPPQSQAPGPMSMYAPSTYAPSGYQAVSSFGPGTSPSLHPASASVDPNQQRASYGYPQQYQDQSKFGSPPPPPSVGHEQPQTPMSEAPTQNPLGVGSNRAELPS